MRLRSFRRLAIRRAAPDALEGLPALEGVLVALHSHSAALADGPDRLQGLTDGWEELGQSLDPCRWLGRATPGAGRGCQVGTIAGPRGGPEALDGRSSDAEVSGCSLWEARNDVVAGDEDQGLLLEHSRNAPRLSPRLGALSRVRNATIRGEDPN
jgi:hypothetical protein